MFGQARPRTRPGESKARHWMPTHSARPRSFHRGRSCRRFRGPGGAGAARRTGGAAAAGARGGARSRRSRCVVVVAAESYTPAPDREVARPEDRLIPLGLPGRGAAAQVRGPGRWLDRGGERGIRTLGTFRYTRFPIVPLRPLGHLSRFSEGYAEERVGVEPTLDLRPNLISNQALSATQPPLRFSNDLLRTEARPPSTRSMLWLRPAFYHSQAAARSSFNFSRTASAWPLAFTRAQWWATLPSGPTITVERMTPMVFLP